MTNISTMSKKGKKSGGPRLRSTFYVKTRFSEDAFKVPRNGHSQKMIDDGIWIPVPRRVIKEGKKG